MKMFLLLATCFLISGCGVIPPIIDDSYWRQQVLSKYGCPDLIGKYRGNFIMHGGIGAGGVSPSDLQYLSSFQRPSEEKLKKNQTYIEYIPLPETEWSSPQTADKDMTFYIHQKSGFLVLDIQLSRGIRRESINLNSPMNGCYDGAFVSRSVTKSSAGDFVPVWITLLEIETRKLADGSLQVTRRLDRQRLSYITGQPTGTLLRAPASTSHIYPPAD